MSSIIDQHGIKRCIIDPNSRQKYVLIEIGDEYLVRGNRSVEFHHDVAFPTIKQLRELNIKYKVLGGGRIFHDADKKQITIYGHSFGFPWHNSVYKHELSEEVVQTEYADFEVIADNTVGLY